MRFLQYLLLFFISVKPLAVAAQISGVVNSSFKVTNVIPAYNGIRVANISGLNVNDRVLIIQMKGATINESNSSSFGNISSINGAGQYEFATICGFLNDTVIFERELQHNYNFNHAVQLVKVPVYNNVSVDGPLQAQLWDPVTETGGVLALSVTGTLTLNAGINADGAGFKGGLLQTFTTCNFGWNSADYFYEPSALINNRINGTYKGEGVNYTIATKEGGRGKQSNGGGGGNNHNSGGGGGSNYGTGGSGGRYTASGFACSGSNVGIGGASLAAYGYTTLNNRIFVGGGGGAGHDNNGFGTPGGNGGGIVFIECNELIANGYTISANGAQGRNLSNPVTNEARGDGGGGGGGGGTIIMNVTTFTGNLNLQARGADGSRAGFQAQCPGPGGGGGGGVIWTNAPLPPNVTATVSGGIAGIINDAVENPSCELTSQLATDGTSGALFSNFSITYTNQFNCMGLLPSPFLLSFNGRKSGDGLQLNWELSQQGEINSVELQRKEEGSAFKSIKTIHKPQKISYGYYDANMNYPVQYRVYVSTEAGNVYYSPILSFSGTYANELKTFPNPVTDQVTVQLPSVLKATAQLTVSDYTGRRVMLYNIAVTNQATYIINTVQLPPGVYFITLTGRGDLWKSKFIKQ